jgi:septal ring factor EnvC (AmiA/AmiB activator)
MRNRLLVTSLLLLLLPALALSATSKKKQLQEINKHIKQVKVELTSSYIKTVSIQKDLRKNEIERSNLAIAKQKTQTQLVSQRLLLKQLKQKETDYQARISMQKRILEQQISATYMLGKQSYLKILLNQDDPAKFSRTLMYYSYIQKSRLDLISNLNVNIANLELIQNSIVTHTYQLKNIINKQQEQDLGLKKLQINRQELLQQMHQKIKNQTQKLQNLIAEKEALEKIIARLQAESLKTKFINRIGPWHNNLPWPTPGKVVNTFGQSIANSQLKSDGVVIYAPMGQKVKAIAAGKVVFAQWLQGYGLLLIIDHGQGYMSLYGRNNVLYHKVGDIVNGNELISEIGNTGGYEQAGLYFAIRYNGKPVNPAAWCRI